MKFLSATSLLLATTMLGSVGATCSRDKKIDERGVWYTMVPAEDGTCVWNKINVSGTPTEGRELKAETNEEAGNVIKLDVMELAFAEGTDLGTLNSALPIRFEVSGLAIANVLPSIENGNEAFLILEPIEDGCKEIKYKLTIGSVGVEVTEGTVEILRTPNPEGCKDVTGTYKVRVEWNDIAKELGYFNYGQIVRTAAASETTRAGPDDIVRNSGTTGTQSAAEPFVDEGPYEGGGKVQDAVGRIYFNSYGVDYACTGTVVKDNKSGRTLIFTAAHCVWDDIDENFGSNVIFVPNRDAVTGETVLQGNMTLADIHRQCADDICGCWDLSGGVVHSLWPDTPWPDRLAYDYGFYVVNDVGDHFGNDCGSDALDIAVDALDFKVGTEIEDVYMNNFGYSLEYNPDFRYCAETTITRDPTAGVTTAWMDSCGLTGGASGGPWIKNFDPATGKGEVVSTNSWSYSSRVGMGGPFIDASAARCLINAAREMDMEAVMALPIGEQGIYAECYDRPCIDDESSVRKLRGGRELCSETIKMEESKP